MCALLFSAGVFAQVAVTFSVDMTGQTVSPNGVHLAGAFNDPDEGGTTYPTDYNAAYPNWSPSVIEMTDVDMDMVYDVTLMLNPAVYQFKFINDNNWGPGEDQIPTTCQVGNGNSNRYLKVGVAATDYSVCWASCAACGVSSVRFRVDMSQQAAVNPAGVHVAGDFQDADGVGAGAEWQAGENPLYDLNNDNVWEHYYSVGAATSIVFKYINGNDWANPNESISGACGNTDGNRVEAITGANTVLPAYCFSSCDPCVQPTMVTFKVNMSLQTVSPNGVHVAGQFQGWEPGDPAGAMLDGDGDGIYEVTIGIQPGNYPYKFVNGNGWTGADNSNESLPAGCNSGGNRTLVVQTTAMTVEYCYNQCTAECISDPNPADITFKVNTNTDGFVVSPDGMWLIGNFTNPQWQGGATLMTDANSDGIYEATLNVSGPADIQYKFVNGVVTVTTNEENTGLAECGIANGIGGFNRTHIRTGVAETLDPVCFNACADCVVSVQEVAVVANLNVYPVPADEVLNITFNSMLAQNLRVNMINNLGQAVMTENLGTVAGNRVASLNVASLAKGIYTLQIAGAIGTQSVRVAVK
jgi:hypothetical protein